MGALLNVLIPAFLLGCAALALRRLRKAKGRCSCGCGGCPMVGACEKEEPHA